MDASAIGPLMRDDDVFHGCGVGGWGVGVLGLIASGIGPGAGGFRLI
jgi:hypothetical protein